MTAITVELTDELAQRLRDEARRLGVSEAELMKLGVERLLENPNAATKALIGEIIAENRELYRRLA